MRQSYGHWSWKLVYSFRNFVWKVRAAFNPVIQSVSSKLSFPTTITPTLKASELQEVQTGPSCWTILSDAVLWIHDMSSSSSVRQVAACGLASEEIWFFSTSSMKNILASKIHLTALSAGKHVWTPGLRMDVSQRAAAKMEQYFRQFDLCPDNPLLDWFPAASAGYTNHLAFIFHVWNVPVDSVDSLGRTALLRAVMGWHFNATKILLDYGANPNIINAEDLVSHSALVWHCRHHLDADAVRIANLLLDAGADINLKGQSAASKTALYEAAEFDELDSVNWALDNRANVDMLGGPAGTALHVAAQLGSLSVVQILLMHGASTTLRNNKGLTPLAMAISNGVKRVESFLLEQGVTE